MMMVLTAMVSSLCVCYVLQVKSGSLSPVAGVDGAASGHKNLPVEVELAPSSHDFRRADVQQPQCGCKRLPDSCHKAKPGRSDLWLLCLDDRHGMIKRVKSVGQVVGVACHHEGPVFQGCALHGLRKARHEFDEFYFVRVELVG